MPEQITRPPLDPQAVVTSLQRAQARLLALEGMLHPSISERTVQALLNDDDIAWMVDQLDSRLGRVIDELAPRNRARWYVLRGGVP